MRSVDIKKAVFEINGESKCDGVTFNEVIGNVMKICEISGESDDVSKISKEEIEKVEINNGAKKEVELMELN
jgi:hypothetical protein